MIAAAATIWRARELSRSSRPEMTSRTRWGSGRRPCTGAISPVSSARMLSTTMNGLPSLMSHTWLASRTAAGASMSRPASARTRAAVSARDSAPRESCRREDRPSDSWSNRRSTVDSLSSSFRTIPTIRSGHASIRRTRKVKSRRLVSSAHCKFSRTRSSGREETRSRRKCATASKTRKGFPPTAALRGSPSSGKSLASSPCQTGFGHGATSSS